VGESSLLTVIFAKLRQVVHRDVKPGNIVTALDGSLNVKLIDFGMACKASATEPTGAVKQHVYGTLDYCSQRAHLGPGRLRVLSPLVKLIACERAVLPRRPRVAVIHHLTSRARQPTLESHKAAVGVRQNDPFGRARFEGPIGHRLAFRRIAARNGRSARARMRATAWSSARPDRAAPQPNKPGCKLAARDFTLTAHRPLPISYVFLLVPPSLDSAQQLSCITNNTTHQNQITVFCARWLPTLPRVAHTERGTLICGTSVSTNARPSLLHPGWAQL
jgi:serine/threonine protein kinase